MPHVYLKGGGDVRLTKADYVARGGQAEVYEKGGVAFKVYHDPSTMMPSGKLAELQRIQDSHITRPQQVLVSRKGAPLGYAMPFIPDAWVLCQLFPKSFRDRNNLKQGQVQALVKKLQDRISAVHKAGVLVVDCNELNWLVAKDFSEVYGIDTDSYQTPSYPATVIMPNIRDPQVKGGAFNEESDWYSFGILACQLFTGIHPFKGKHPGFTGAGKLEQRMAANVSIFNSAVKVPKSVLPFDVIPPRYRQWMEAVFEHGERVGPPTDLTGASITVIPQIRHLLGQRVKITELFTYGGLVIGYAESHGAQVVLTNQGAFLGSTRVANPTPGRSVGTAFSSRLNRPVTGHLDGRGLKLFDVIERRELNLNLHLDSAMCVDGRFYVRVGEGIYEVKLNELGNKIQPTTVKASSCSNKATRLYTGCAIQDLMGKTWVSLYPESGKHYQCALPELDGYAQIVEAQAQRNVLMVVAAKKDGTYDRLVYRFSFRPMQDPLYDVRILKDIHPSGLNFVVLGSGVVALINEDEDLEMFAAKRGHKGVKLVSDPVLGTDMTLGVHQGKVIFWRGDRIYRLEAR
jgi:hypothetical protein